MTISIGWPEHGKHVVRQFRTQEAAAEWLRENGPLPTGYTIVTKNL